MYGALSALTGVLEDVLRGLRVGRRERVPAHLIGICEEGEGGGQVQSSQRERPERNHSGSFARESVQRDERLSSIRKIATEYNMASLAPALRPRSFLVPAPGTSILPSCRMG